jgi:hypothetical protein
MTDDEVLNILRQAFASVQRPEHFTDHPGCSECAEHDETLQQRDHDSLSYDDVGSAGWNPITMCQPQAFAYWLPALARIALAPEHPQWGWYGEQLFRSELRWDGPRNWRWAYCTPEQRRGVATLIEHVIDTRAALIREYDIEHEMLEVLEIWSDAGEDFEDPNPN